MAHIAFLGTGLLGSAFAEAAAKRGDTVTAWNRSPDKVAALAPFGVKSATTPADAVRGASRVHLVLKDDAVVDDVVSAARGGLSADAILIDHTTTLPRLTAKRAERLRAEGMKYLHCPVFMGPPAARNAQGVMLATGPKALFESVQADLAKMTGRLQYMGERTDLAAVNKLLGNAMIIGVCAVMADVLTLAKSMRRRCSGRRRPARVSRHERDGRTTRDEHGIGRLQPEFRTGHGAQGCAADARDVRRPANGDAGRDRFADGSTDCGRTWCRGLQRACHRRGTPSVGSCEVGVGVSGDLPKASTWAGAERRAVLQT